MNIMELLTHVFREVFENDDINLSREMTANDVDGWDSLSHINLIVTIEARFKIKFLQKELLSFNKVGDLIDAIEKKFTN
jgi:acyl carrier protein